MTRPRTALLVTYEFPPTGGPGVQRVAKFGRYLPEFGWRVEVIAAQMVPGRPVDETLAREVRGVNVTRTPARSIAHAVGRVLSAGRRMRDGLRRRRGPGAAEVSAVSGARSTQPRQTGRTEQVTRLVAVPDYARLWIGPAVRAGVRVGRQVDADVVIASAPPFSCLIAGARIARRLGVPFVADFRDAWRDNPLLAEHPTAWHRDRSLALERAVLTSAAAVTTAHPIREEITELGGPEPVVIPNGFDPEDVPPWTPPEGMPFVMTFMGTLYGVNDPWPVLEAMKTVREQGHDVRFRIIGQWPPHVEQTVRALSLTDAVEFQPYLPHAEALARLAASDLGVIIYADSPRLRASTPGKLYEYLGIGVPILFVGPVEGVAPDLVREARAGAVVSYADPAGIALEIARRADAKERGEAPASPDPAVVGRYRRKDQAGVLASLLDSEVAT